MNVNLWLRKSSPKNWRGRFFVTIYDALLLESKSPPVIASHVAESWYRVPWLQERLRSKNAACGWMLYMETW